MMNIKALKLKFHKIFKTNPEFLFSCPSRINLIGEHTDYNGGFVLPCAISKRAYAFVSKRNDKKICLASNEISNVVECELTNIKNESLHDWANYPLGIFATLIMKGYNLDFGLNILYSSEIPLGSGLSSSAAILCLTGFVLSNIYGLDLTYQQIADIAHLSETEFNGLKCGIMDEYAIALGKNKKGILLNCDNRTFDYVPVSFKPYLLIVIVSNVKRELLKSPYNQRVIECNQALELLKPTFKVSSLCELNISDLNMANQILKDDVLKRRVKHVVNENNRVKLFVEALKGNDISLVSSLLNESQISLKEDYEVTGQYLDYLHDISLTSGAIAERMTGAGFGGSAIALVKEENYAMFKENVVSKYNQKFGFKPDIFIADICNSFEIIKI